VARLARTVAAPAVIRPASPVDIERVASWADIARLVTAAPEIPGGLELGRALSRAGIIPSIGHSDAFYPEVTQALESGYRSVTHLFCMLSSWRNIAGEKTLGGSESALLLDELFVELIADGRHVSGPMLQLALKSKGEERICLVTDSIWAAGLAPGQYDLGGVPIVVSKDSARLLDGSANAGSVATMDLCLRNMIDLGKATLEQAVQMGSTTPARLLGLDHRLGAVAAGMDADLVVLDRDLTVQRTVVQGRQVYAARASTAQRN
jgi:N-acetylglucosamine-6-phosphate deacetylase